MTKGTGNGGFYFEEGDLDYDPKDEVERMVDFDDEDDEDDNDYDYYPEDDERDEDAAESYYEDREHRWLMDNFDDI